MNFIVERSLWSVGVRERIIRSVNTTLKKILRKSLVSFEELRNIMIEVEAILNFRPLICVFSVPRIQEPLPQEHFLTYRISLILLQRSVPQFNEYKIMKMTTY